MASAATNISHDVLPKPQTQSQSLTDALSNMKQTIELNRHLKCEIEQLTMSFMNIYSNFQDDISQSSINDTVADSFKEPIGFDLKFLNEHRTHDRIQLALCGPNSSGKTTFLHSFLKINNILPVGAGPITARIVKFTYTIPSSACLIIYPSIQDAYAENVKEEQKLPLSGYFIGSVIDWKGIEKLIRVHIARPDVKTEKEFVDWAKKFVEIRIPSPTLELGIDVYDTPGILFHDQPTLKDNLQELVRHVRPTLVFLYANASFAKDANDCYLTVRSALCDLEEPPIFYLNTKQDITTLFNGVGISSQQVKQFTAEKYNEILPNERLKRYQQLFEAVGIANNLPLIENNKASAEIFDTKCDNFDICSIIVGRSLLRECAIKMTEQACQRITEFAMKTEMKPAYEMADSVLAKIDNIFNFATSASLRTKERWDNVCSNAKIWCQKFFEKFKKELSKITEKVHEKIIQRFDGHSNNIIERAIKLERSDDPLQCKTIDVVKKNIKDFIKIVVQEEVIKVAVNEIINETKNELLLMVKHEILISTKKNELLIAAQNQVLIDISSDDITQRGWIEHILFQISIAPSALLRLILGLSILPYQDYWNKINSTVSKAGEKFYKILDSMDSFSILTDETKRREFATEYLRRLRSKIAAEKDLYSQNLQLWIENEKERFDNNIQSNYHLALSNLTTRNIAYELTNKYIKLFAEVECKLLAVKDLAKFNGQHPVINETAELGHGTHFTVYPAEWSIKKNLAVKRLKQTSPEYAYLQYLEAHTHRKITQLCLTIPSKVREESPQIRMPHIVPLLYLYESVGKNSKLNLCMFLPRYSQSLDKFLQENIAKIKPDRVLQIGLDMADVLVLLHANDIVHRDFKAGNILMDENQQCYLADFGTAREWITNSTVLGTFPLAPEVISNSIYDGLASDVYSFGVFLYELLPKTTYSRPDGVTTITETLKTIAPLNEHNRIYENLIEWCLEPSPKDRPSAAMVKSKLLECLKELEKKTCMTCFNKLRKYRFQPCAHKLVCETCWNNLPKNSEGKSICIICWQIIEWVTEDDNNETYFPRRASVTDIGMAINSDALLW